MQQIGHLFEPVNTLEHDLQCRSIARPADNLIHMRFFVRNRRDDMSREIITVTSSSHINYHQIIGPITSFSMLDCALALNNRLQIVELIRFTGGYQCQFTDYVAN